MVLMAFLRPEFGSLSEDSFFGGCEVLVRAAICH